MSLTDQAHVLPEMWGVAGKPAGGQMTLYPGARLVCQDLRLMCKLKACFAHETSIDAGIRLKTWMHSFQVVDGVFGDAYAVSAFTRSGHLLDDLFLITGVGA